MNSQCLLRFGSMNIELPDDDLCLIYPEKLRPNIHSTETLD